jgi:hypothetical protein
MGRIHSYKNYIALFEGGAAIKTSRRIKEREVPGTLDSIKEILFPLIGDGEIDKDYLVIGSVGKKKGAEETSGDIDLGIDKSFIARKYSTNADNVLEFIYDKLTKELPDRIGFVPDIKLMKGINVISIGWPIEGDPNNGIVQLDLIPLSDMDWAKFIFYSPDYRKNESRYKSAHRNWLFQAILSSLKEVITEDPDGEMEDFYSYALRLSDGIFKNKKSFKGATKRLKNPKTVSGSTEFITREPDEFIEMILGKGFGENDVKTFEDVWSIVSSPDFIHSDKFEDIKKDLLRYLENGGYEIPVEVR